MATPLPKLSSPARSALAAVGVDDLESLAQWTEEDVLALHGMGPASMPALREALAEADLEFEDE